jgi:hypothetical protein
MKPQNIFFDAMLPPPEKSDTLHYPPLSKPWENVLASLQSPGIYCFKAFAFGYSMETHSLRLTSPPTTYNSTISRLFGLLYRNKKKLAGNTHAEDT